MPACCCSGPPDTQVESLENPLGRDNSVHMAKPCMCSSFYESRDIALSTIVLWSEDQLLRQT